MRGYYAATHYRIVDDDGTELYIAGNSPMDSQVYLPAEDPRHLSIDIMQQYCDQTGHELATEAETTYTGSEQEEDLVDEPS